MPLRYERPRHPRVWGVQWARAVRRHADAQTSRQPHAPTGNRRVRGTDTRKTIRTFLLLGTATAILSGARCVRAQPGATAAPKVLFSEDFENGLPGNWEGAPLLSEGLPAGSTGAACAKPGEDIKSNHAWADGHFTVEDGLYFNYWARFDSAQWYQAFVFCKAKGQEAKDRSLYEAEPPVFNDTDWHLVSIPFADFKATMGPNQGNSPKPGEVCWTYFWSFQKRNLGMAVDKVWVTKGKRGVNRVRFHGNFTPKEGQALAETDKDEREQLWRLVAAMKPEGLYTTFSPYWAASSRVKPAMGVLDSGGEVGNHGLLFFDAKLQAAYKSWLKQVLTEKNPHTGLPLAQDPALAIIQLQNEDSLLFWTSQGTKGAAAAELRRQFAKFLTGKYGSLEKAKTAWGGDSVKEDSFAAGEVGLYIIWNLTQDEKTPGKAQRFADQMQFFTETMYSFNKTMGDYLRNELGCKQLVNAGNWRTADNVKMLDAERYSYCANEVMGVNRSYTGVHEGQHNGWAIVNGDRFTDDSVLLQPRQLPVTLKQVEGHPMMVPEGTWVPPLGYQSEGPFLIAAYQSLTGVDAYYWFATGEEDWRQPGSANGYLPSEGKWVCATPMVMGQWPAAALLYRLGYVHEGEPAVYEQRSLDDLWFRRMPIIAEDPGCDPNRDTGSIAQESNVKDGVDPLAYLIGPVRAKYDGDPSKSKVVVLAKYLDENAKTIRSVTGELTWDYANGVCTLNAPKAQGVTGFLSKGGTFKLADVEIRSGNEYASVLAVSMDDQPLSNSGKTLVQVGTTERPPGWKTRPVDSAVEKETRKGELVLNFGTKPWQIVEGEVALTIANPSLKAAHVLDANGMSVKDVPLEAAGGGKRLTFPPDAMCVVVE